MKLANIFFGTESAASTHPCPWCSISKEKMQDFQIHGELRTLGSIRSSANAYKTACKDFLKKSNFQLHFILCQPSTS